MAKEHSHMKLSPAVIRRIALAVVSAGALVLCGCESSQQAADEPAQEQYDAAVTALDQNQLPAAISAIDAAGALSGLSEAMTTQVHGLQGELHSLKANQLLDQAVAVELNASRLLGELRMATIRVRTIQEQLASDAGYDPADGISKLQAKIADAQGGAGQEYWKGEQLLSLAGIDAQSAKLQQQIADNRAQAKAFLSQKDAAAEQGDALQQKSLSDTGQQSVDDVAAAAAARYQAALAGTAAEKLDAAVVDLQADLAGVQGQRVGVQQAIEAYNKQISDLGIAWKSVQQDMDLQRRSITAMVGPGEQAPAPADETANLPLPTTIADQCTELKALIAADRDLRDQATGELNKADRAYSAAAAGGDLLRTALADDMQSDKTPPNVKSALQRLQETYAGGAYHLAAADTERALAMNYSSEVMISIQARQALSSAQASLGADAPAAIADCLASIASPSVDDLSQSAEDAFKNAMDHYDGQMTQMLPGPAAQSRKAAAMVGKMLTVFGAKQLSMALADKPVAGQSPKELQGVIDDLATNLAAVDPTRLPAIPYTLSAAPPAQ